jgi:alkylated DNA repair dioxygenase AlkB
VPQPQPDLFASAAPGPPGFAYRSDVIAREDESALAARLAALPFEPFQFRGYEGRRRVVSFGLRYDFNGAGLVEAPAIPDWLAPLRAVAADLAGVEPAVFAHLLVNEYRPGAPIGWHRDRPAFGKVVGISLLAPALMRFRRRMGGRFERISVPLAPRSAYLLDGPARSEWEHSLPPAAALRYSLTFRTLRQ